MHSRYRGPRRRIPAIWEPINVPDSQILEQDNLRRRFVQNDVVAKNTGAETAVESEESEESEGETAARLEGKYGDRFNQLETLLDMAREEKDTMRRKREGVKQELDDTRQKLEAAHNTIANLHEKTAARDLNWGLLEPPPGAELPYRRRFGSWA